MPLPDHPIWKALEGFFRAQITRHDSHLIIDIIRQIVAEQPQANMDEVTLQVAQAVLKRRSQARAHR